MKKTFNFPLGLVQLLVSSLHCLGKEMFLYPWCLKKVLVETFIHYIRGGSAPNSLDSFVKAMEQERTESTSCVSGEGSAMLWSLHTGARSKSDSSTSCISGSSSWKEMACLHIKKSTRQYQLTRPPSPGRGLFTALVLSHLCDSSSFDFQPWLYPCLWHLSSSGQEVQAFKGTQFFPLTRLSLAAPKQFPAASRPAPRTQFLSLARVGILLPQAPLAQDQN